MLRVHVLNVGNGDAQIIEHANEQGRVFGVIDSNHTGPGEPRALQRLKELGATELSFMVLTHPHADHYSGLREILEHFHGRIGSFYTFENIRQARLLKKIIDSARSLLNRSDESTIHSRLLEFLNIMRFLERNNIDIIPFSGHLAQVTGAGFDGVAIRAFLPSTRERGVFERAIETGEFVAESSTINESSLGFVIDYGGSRLILAGDGTAKNIEVSTRTEYLKGQIKSAIVKLPHHGSKYDNTPGTLERMFAQPDRGERHAIVSAGGIKHPDADVLQLLSEQKIKPYCTRLARICGAKARTNSPPSGNLEPSLSRFVEQVSIPIETGSPCQGDICIELDAQGGTQIRRQYQNACWLRGEVPVLQLN